MGEETCILSGPCFGVPNVPIDGGPLAFEVPDSKTSVSTLARGDARGDAREMDVEASIRRMRVGDCGESAKIDTQHGDGGNLR